MSAAAMYLSANLRNVGSLARECARRVLAKTDIAIDERGSDWRELTRPQVLLAEKFINRLRAKIREEHTFRVHPVVESFYAAGADEYRPRPLWAERCYTTIIRANDYVPGSRLLMASLTRSPQPDVSDHGLGWRITCRSPSSS